MKDIIYGILLENVFVTEWKLPLEKRIQLFTGIMDLFETVECRGHLAV